MTGRGAAWRRPPPIDAAQLVELASAR